jgi:D-alanine-D-alanine ligase
MPKPRVGVIFGSRSPEHDISIITAQQIIAALDTQKYEVVPIYITRDGKWYTGSKLMRLESFTNQMFETRGLVPVFLGPGSGHSTLSALKFLHWFQGAVPLAIDIAFPAVHGPFGEDGTLQGLLELANIPYVGSGVVASAVGMDKLVMKSVLRGYGLPILPYLGFSRYQWESSQEGVLREIEAVLPYPVFVKPANLGSSIAVSKAKDRHALTEALELAAHFDRRLVVEKGLDEPLEINCAVIGNEELRVSPCEQPIRHHDFLSFEDKYVRGGKSTGMKGADRLIPAPLEPELITQIQGLARKAFQACDCRGTARVDFLIERNGRNVFVNEINTIPGSLAFYLWQHMGIDFTALCDMLIDQAIKNFHEKERTTYSLPLSLLHRQNL